MDYKALHRFADTGPRKIRLFADLIRGKNVDEALQLLRFYHNRGAKLLEAVVKSALGNADDLRIVKIDTCHRIAGLWFEGLFFQRNYAPIRIELDHAIALRVVDWVGKDRGAGGARCRLTQGHGEVMPDLDVVAPLVRVAHQIANLQDQQFPDAWVEAAVPAHPFGELVEVLEALRGIDERPEKVDRAVEQMPVLLRHLLGAQVGN